MPDTLKNNERQFLRETFQFRTDEEADTRTLPVRNLLETDALASYVRRLKSIFEVRRETVAISMFSSRYSYLVAVPTLFTMSEYNKGLDLTFDNLKLEVPEENNTWSPGLVLNPSRPSGPNGNRHNWRDQVLKQIFADHLQMLWSRFHEQYSISPELLWENTAVWVFWLYETFQDRCSGADWAEDFQYLLRDVPECIFEADVNPISQFYHKKGNDGIRYRSTCCLYYRTNPERDRCTSCPHMK